MTSPEIPTEETELGSVDLNIPLLALEAANELDDLIYKRETPLQAVERLTEILRHSFSIGATGPETFVDSGTVAVFSEALSEAQPGAKLTTMDELKERAGEIVGDFDITGTGSDPARLETLRDFCIALSASAASFRNSVYEAQPPHPFEA